MTLIVAQRKDLQVSLTADTRFHFGDNMNFDFGIKVSPLHIMIRSPRKSDFTITVDYDHHVGIAVTGSVIAATTIKEYMAAAMVNVQYTPGYTDFSFQGIVKFIAKFYEKICKEMSELLREKGICEMVLAGFCVAEERIRAFYLTMDISDFPIKIVTKEILKEEGMEFFGSGKKEAAQVHKDNPDYSALNLVRRVIYDEKNPTVGGAIQLGEFYNKNFEVRGLMIDNPTNENPNNCDWNLWGINHHEGAFDIDDESYLLNIPFLMAHDTIDFTNTESEKK